LTDIVPRLRVPRDAVVVFFREAAVVFLRDTAVVFFFREAVVVLFRDAAAVFLRDTAVVFFREAVVFFRAPVDRVVVVFLRDPEDEARDLEELPDDFELELDFDFDSPDCERCLLTVRAAISFERFVDRPCFRSESRMCSYWRSRLSLHDSGIVVRPPDGFLGGQHMPGTCTGYSSETRRNYV
jgi:hypothetical protein